MKTEVTLGIDIGGTNTAIGLIDRAGICHSETVFPTNKYTQITDLVKDLHTFILSQTRSLDIALVGIGIGAPNGNYYQGTIEHAVNLPWKGRIPLVELFQQQFSLTTFITNDAKAATIGEMLFGGANGMKNFVVITLGTGLGCGMVVNGQLVYGEDGLAGELGHTNILPNGRSCNCGLKGCLETYVSATGIKRTLHELLATENSESRLRSLSFHEITAKDIFNAAQAGDPIAAKAFLKTGEILGSSLANLVALIRPEAIFLLGGLAQAGEWIFKSTIEQMEKNVLPVFRGKVKILPSALPNNAAIFGASAFAWNELQNRS